MAISRATSTNYCHGIIKTTCDQDIAYFQSGVVEHRICQEPFQLRVFVFQRLQPLGLGHVHATEPGFPFIDTGIADAVLATKLRDRRARLVLLQNADDLFVCKTVGKRSLQSTSVLA